MRPKTYKHLSIYERDLIAVSAVMGTSLHSGTHLTPVGTGFPGGQITPHAKDGGSRNNGHPNVRTWSLLMARA